MISSDSILFVYFWTVIYQTPLLPLLKGSVRFEDQKIMKNITFCEKKNVVGLHIGYHFTKIYGKTHDTFGLNPI